MNDDHNEHLDLSDDQLERLADLLATKLASMRPATQPLLTVEDVATIFKVSRAWVYGNAVRLGGIRLGPGERAPLRFDAERVAAAFTPLGASQLRALPTNVLAPTRPQRRRPKRLLPVYDG
jgi:hypothetical protein